MAGYMQLPVYQEAYQLFLQLVQFSDNMQRDMRYTLGEQTKKAVMELILDIYRANEARDKTADLEKARERLVEVQLLIRVLNETRQLSNGRFALLIERTASISKQLAGWARHCAEISKTEIKKQEL